MRHRWHVAAALTLSVLVTACCDEGPDRARAVSKVDAEFKQRFEALALEDGSRIIRGTKAAAFQAIEAALTRLGMQRENRDPTMGLLSLRGRAPAPLSEAEWAIAKEQDLPILRGLVAEVCGEVQASFTTFEPEDYDILIDISVLESGPFVELTVIARMQRREPVDGVPHRTYPPPHAARLALRKFWSTVLPGLRA